MHYKVISDKRYVTVSLLGAKKFHVRTNFEINNNAPRVIYVRTHVSQ